MKLFSSIIFLCYCSSLIIAAPLFNDYSVSSTYKMTVSKLNYSNETSRRPYRKVFKHTVSRKPNFAGHYYLVTFSCGTMCIATGLVDAKSGETSIGPTAAVGAKFNVNSRLLIVNPAAEIQIAYPEKAPQWLKTRYFKLKNNKFIEILKKE